MPKGKKSIKSIIDENLGGFWNLLEKHCANCKTKEEACNIINPILKENSIVLNPGTLYAIIKKTMKKEKIKEIFQQWVVTGQKGKKSVKISIEEKVGDFWELIKKYCSSCGTKEEACEILNSILKPHKIEIKPQTLANTIEKAVQNKELTNEFFVKWAIKKKIRKNKKEINEAKIQNNKELKQNLVTLPCECQNCGTTIQRIFDKQFLKEQGAGMQAMKCPKCNLWATLAINTKIHKEKIKNWKQYNDKFK